MASLQREDNFVGIAHGILEGLAMTEWHQHERRVLDVLFLETYGRLDPDNKGRQLTHTRLKTGYLAQKTRLSERRVREALSSLVARRVVECIEQPSGSKAGTYGFQKYYEHWLPPVYRNRRLTGARAAANTGARAAGKSSLTAHVPPQIPAHVPPVNFGERRTCRRQSGARAAVKAAHVPPVNLRESSTTTGVEASVEIDIDNMDRSIDLHGRMTGQDDPWQEPCKYRTALQSLRLILNAKEERRLGEFVSLEAKFPAADLLEALQARVAQAERFADRGSRTCWALIKASEDLASQSRSRASPSPLLPGHSPPELEFQEDD